MSYRYSWSYKKDVPVVGGSHLLGDRALRIPRIFGLAHRIDRNVSYLTMIDRSRHDHRHNGNSGHIVAGQNLLVQCGEWSLLYWPDIKPYQLNHQVDKRKSPVEQSRFQNLHLFV